MKKQIIKEFLEKEDLRVWGIYWFDRTWLSEKSNSKKGDYRPCVVFKITKKQLVLIPMSSYPTTPEWNIEYKSATRKEGSHMNVDNIRILDPRSLKNSKRSERLSIGTLSPRKIVW